MTRHATPGRQHSRGLPRSHATIGGVSVTAPDRRTTAGPGLPAASGRTAILVLVAVVLVVMLALPIRSWFVQQARISVVENQMIATEQQLAALEQEQELWADPRFVEQQARERLNYVLPGEVSLVVLATQSEAEPDVAQTWQQRLWSSVDAAAGRTDSASAGDPLVIREDAPR